MRGKSGCPGDSFFPTLVAQLDQANLRKGSKAFVDTTSGMQGYSQGPQSACSLLFPSLRVPSHLSCYSDKLRIP